MKQSQSQILLTDLGNVLIYSKESELGGKLNPRHRELVEQFGEHYPFFDYFGVRERLVKLYSVIRQTHPIYMITEGTIQNVPILKERLESAIDYQNIFSTNELGLDKKTPDAYRYVTKMLGVEPKSIFYLDDSQENAHAALIAGLSAHQFETEDQAIEILQKAFK